MASPHYVIRGGLQGRERLRVLALVTWPTTRVVLEPLVTSESRCLDVGCGGGDVTTELARLAPNGWVAGMDLDETKLELARSEAVGAGLSNVEYRVEDVMHPVGDGERFDVIYTRFVLTHLPDPASAVSNLRARLAPGGVLLVEDIDFTGHFCHPSSDAFWRYVELYTNAVQARGADPNIGPRLPALLRDAGLDGVEMRVVQPAGLEGEVKLISPITLEAIADAVVGAGLASREDLEQVIDDLWAFACTDGTLMSIPRIVQAWARTSS